MKKYLTLISICISHLAVMAQEKLTGVSAPEKVSTDDHAIAYYNNYFLGIYNKGTKKFSIYKIP